VNQLIKGVNVAFTNVGVDRIVHRILKFRSAETDISVSQLAGAAIEAQLIAELGKDLYEKLRNRAEQVENQRVENQQVA